MNKKIILFSTVLLILVFSVLLILGLKTINKNSSKIDSVDSSTGRIYFLSYEDSSHQIKFYDKEKAETKTVFSDKDEHNKLENIGSFSTLSSEFFTYMQNSDKGELVAFKLTSNSEKLEKHIIRTDFLRPESVTADPLGRIIYYSNSVSIFDEEMHFLYEENRDGKNKRLIYQSKSEILNLQVSNDAKKIIFTQDGNSIVAINLDDFKVDKLYQSADNVRNLSILDNGNLIFTNTDLKNINSGAIYLKNMITGELKKIFSYNQAMPASPVLSPNLRELSFIQKIFTDKINDSQSGDLVLAKTDFKEINKIGSAIKIICWQP